MGRRGMPGRRRQVLQLEENTTTSYLTQTGCYRPDDMFVEGKVKTGLSLVGEYSDSESDSEGEEEQTEPDVEYNLNGDIQMGGEESQIVTEKNDSLQAEMLELVGVKKETPADIFLREFQAYQKESVAPVYNREFIAFQKETKENTESSPSSSSSSKDAQKESTTKTSDDASSATKTDKAPSSGLKAPDIDSQVASFLAEIDALGDEEEKEKVEESNETGGSDRSSSVDREQNGQSSTTSSDSKDKDPPNGNNATTGTSSTAKEEVKEDAATPVPPKEEKIVWPEEPKTDWQQCYDGNTQHCYYWNITSNEVTWEIPAEFTQYLLLYREYEEKVAKLMKEGKSKPRKKKAHRKSEKNKAKQSETESETSSKDSSAEPQVEYGPHLPPSSDNQKDTCSSPETAGPDPAGQVSPKESTEPMYGPMVKPDTPPEENKEKCEESDASNASSTGKNMHNTVTDNIEEEEEDNNTTDNKECVAASTTSVTDTVSPNDSVAVTVSKTSEDEGSTGESLTADLAMIELCKKKFKARMSREEDNGKSSASLSADSGAKENSVPTELEGSLLDIDEVDRELELALERKKCELKSLEEEEEKQSHESVKVRGKRKHRNDRASDDSSADEVSPPKSSKRSRDQRSRDQRSRDRKESSKHSKKAKHKKDDTNGVSSDDSCPPTSKKSRSSDQKKSHRSHQSKKESRPKKGKERDSKSRSCDDEENKLKETALDLSQLVIDKMDFLEIDVLKQSKLQLLCIQLKTRISDWHAGGLSTKYFYVKLQEANQQLGQYEKSGAPAGWSVNWDRTCKRYFYTNNTTGDSQWEYPEPPSKEEGNELPDNPGSIVGLLSLPPPPPPPSSSPLPSPIASEKTQEASEEADKEHQKVAKECERRRDRSSSEKEKYLSSKSEGRREKRSRKESKSSKSSRSKDSSKSKSHSENSSCSKLEDYDCEMSVYPGEPPPPGTEPNLQPSATIISSASISQTNSPQLDNKDPLNPTTTAEDDLEDVMNLAASLGEPVTERTSASGVTDVDDMEIDPEDEVATPAPLLPSADFNINSTNAGSNGTIVSMPDVAGSHNANSSAVISKPPHLTRPAVGAESTAASGLESTLSYSGRMEASVSDTPGTYIAFSCLPELSNESSNSPKPTDNHEATDPVKKEKKKKKDKVITGTSLTLKKKNVSSLVQKWQKVKKEVEKEDELARHEFSDGD